MHMILKNIVFLFFSLLLICLSSAYSFAAGETSRILKCPTCKEFALLPQYFTGESVSISADGRYIAFELDESATPGNITNTQIAVHDRLNRKTTLVSVNNQGVAGNDWSFLPKISADGRYVAFASEASNFVSGDGTGRCPVFFGCVDIFIHDRVSKKSTLVSVSSSGEKAFDTSFNPTISADGRFVAFESLANNLVVGDQNFLPDIFVRDRLTNKTERINVSSMRIETNGSSGSSSISSDGRFVAFDSYASNLVPEDTNQRQDVFVHDRTTKITSRISVNSDGAQGNGDSVKPTISADGRIITFVSNATNLVGKDNNGHNDVFVHDRLTHQTTMVSVSSAGIQGNAASGLRDFNSFTNYFLSGAPVMNASARFVAFTSIASNLVEGDNNAKEDIFLHDRSTKQTTLISVNTNGFQGDYGSFTPMLSANGRTIAFLSYASNLVSNDNNGSMDIFIRDRTLDTKFKADLSITATQKPSSLTKNNQGNFVYTINNGGPDNIAFLKLQHIVSNGELIKLTPEKGTCKTYASISLCNLGNFPAGTSLAINMDIKAIRPNLRQNLTVSSAGKSDPIMTNNYLNISTPVTP